LNSLARNERAALVGFRNRPWSRKHVWAGENAVSWNEIWSQARYLLSTPVMYTVYGITAFATTAFSLVWSKYPVRWLLVLAVIGLAIFVFIHDFPELDPDLPWVFLTFFKYWIFLLGTVALLSTSHLVALLVRDHWGEKKKEDTGSVFADIDAAWQEVQIQMSRARIDLSDQALYILLTPDESLAASVVSAAGLQLFARAPLSADAPLHGYAVADALFLSCAGMYAAARPVAEGAAEPPAQDGTARLEYLCRLIAAANLERPTLRGIAVLVPYEWTRGTESLLQVSAIRDDLETIRQTLKLRCPTVSVFCVRGALAGFSEFTSRLPSRERHQRCGFSVPVSLAMSGEVIRRGMDWMSCWFALWSLNLMVSDVRNTQSNSRLLAMNLALRENRDNLGGLLESALTVHSQAEPLLYRGCYFVGAGSEAERGAFAAGLLNGAKRGKLLVDRDLTRWSRDADRLDRGYRLAAVALGLVAGGGSLAIWLTGILPRIHRVAQRDWWYGTAIVGLALLVLLWAGAFLVPWVRRFAARRS
jgi:IcmF-related N-terminal domain